MFHFEDDTKKPIDIYSGWIIIDDYLEYNECLRFVDFLDKKYGEEYPSFYIVMLEYDLFHRLN